MLRSSMSVTVAVTRSQRVLHPPLLSSRAPEGGARLSMSKLLSLPLPKAPMLWKRWRPLHGAAHALALTESARLSGRVIVAATRDSASAHALEADLTALVEPGVPVLHFPDWETLPYDLFAPHPDIVSQRIATLYRLPSVTKGVLVVPISTLMQRLPPTRYIGDRKSDAC